MFRKYYKQANDDIVPDRELIDKIFEQADKKTVRTGRARIYRFGTAVAAVLILAVSAAAYPQIIRYGSDSRTVAEKQTITDKQSDADKNAAPGNDSAAEKTTAENENGSAEDSVKADAEVKGESGKSSESNGASPETAVRQKQRNENTALKQKNSGETVIGNAQAADEKKTAGTAVNEKETAASDNAAEESEIAEDIQLRSKAFGSQYMSGAVTFSAAAEDGQTPDEVSGGGSGGSANSEDGAASQKLARAVDAGEYSGETVIWSEGNYIKYLGIDPVGGIVLPSGMKNITPDSFYLVAEKGTLINDTATYVFSDSNDRYIYMTVSKLCDDGGMYKNNSNAVNKNIGGKAVFMKVSDKFIDAYFEYKGVNFTVNAYGLNESEIDAMISSIR